MQASQRLQTPRACSPAKWTVAFHVHCSCHSFVILGWRGWTLRKNVKLRRTFCCVFFYCLFVSFLLNQNFLDGRIKKGKEAICLASRKILHLSIWYSSKPSSSLCRSPGTGLYVDDISHQIGCEQGMTDGLHQKRVSALRLYVPTLCLTRNNNTHCVPLICFIAWKVIGVQCR